MAEAGSPSPGTGILRWTARRKADLVTAIREGTLKFEDALSRYDLSAEELQSWIKRYTKYGKKGLRTTKLQEFPLDDTDTNDK